MYTTTIISLKSRLIEPDLQFLNTPPQAGLKISSIASLPTKLSNYLHNYTRFLLIEKSNAQN